MTLEANLHQRYLYANGRPLRMDMMDAWFTPGYYYRYNARGDAAVVDQVGAGGNWGSYGAMGMC